MVARAPRGRDRRRARYTRRVRILMAEHARTALEALAEERERLMSDVVRAALDAHVAAADAGELASVEPVGRGPWDSDTTVVVRPEVADRLAGLADRHGRSVSAEARAAIDAYLRAAGLDRPAEREPSLLTA